MSMPGCPLLRPVADQGRHAVTASTGANSGLVKRASPFSSAVKKALVDLYADLATYSFLTGLSSKMISF